MEDDKTPKTRTNGEAVTIVKHFLYTAHRFFDFHEKFCEILSLLIEKEYDHAKEKDSAAVEQLVGEIEDFGAIADDAVTNIISAKMEKLMDAKHEDFIKKLCLVFVGLPELATLSRPSYHDQ